MPPADSAAPPAAVERPASHLLLAEPLHASRPTSSTAFCLRAVPPLPCHAAPSARRPPPHRRCGKPKSEPRPSFSRAHEHYKYPSKLILSLFCFFPSPTHRNTFAAPSISAAAPALTQSHLSATAQPKSNPPAPSSCFTGPPWPDLLRCSSPEHRLRLHRPPPIAGARGAITPGHPDLDTGHLQVRLELLKLPDHSTLAAGEPRCQKKAGHCPSLFPIQPGTSLLEFKEP